MPGPYTFRLREGKNGFDYPTLDSNNPGATAHLEPGESLSELDACQMKAVIAAALAANPNGGGVNGLSRLQDDLNAECPATPNPVTPQPAPATPPAETNPAPAGGDTASQQAAPDPPVTGTVGGTSTDGGATGGGDNPNPAPTEEPIRPPDGEPDINNGGEQPQEQTNAGDPVDLFNGAFYLEETDLIIPNTILPLSFSRFYRSGAASFGPFGWNWDHNFNLFIRELNTGDIALWRNLHEEIFKFDGANFEPQRGVFQKLDRVNAIAQAYEITAEGGVVMRFERPGGWIDGERIPLLWIKDRHGNQLNFTYGAEDKLAEVRDDDDRFFKFDYDQCGLLVAVSDNAGRKFLYEHDEQTMQLVCVVSPAIADHPDGIRRIYHYEQPWTRPELRHNIIRVEDAVGNVYVENTYDQDPASWSYARVTEQLYGGFLYQFQYTQLQWVPANAVYINIPAVRVEVMNPDFGLETYTFNYRGDLLDRRYRLSKDKSYRVVAWLYEFDEQGNLSKITNPDGSEEINDFDFSNVDPRMRNNLLQKEITSASGFPSPSRIIWRGKYEPVYQQIIEEKNEASELIKYKYDFDLSPAALTNTGKLIEVIQPTATLPDGAIQTAKTTYEYNVIGQLTATILPNGVRNENEYGAAGNEKSRLIKQKFDVGNLNIVNVTKYDSYGFATEKIDGSGVSNKQIYNALGLMEKTILPAINGVAAEVVLHYDTDKKVILSEKPKGSLNDVLISGNFISDSFERDVLGYPVKYILSSNTSEPRVVNVCNDFRGKPVETINPDGSKIRQLFDERGLPLTEEVIGTDGKKITSKKVYDRSGKLTQETNPFGLTTKYEYDGFSRIGKVILANGTEIKNKWLKNDLLESEETIGDDGTGVIRQLFIKTYAYDEKNRKISEVVKVFDDNPAVFTNTTTTIFYDELDRVTKIIDDRGAITSKEYDGLGRIIVETDAEGNEQHHKYDNNANLIQTESHDIEPDGTTSIIIKQFKYDERNRRIELIEPDGSKVISEYDDRNLLIKQTDHSGVIKETTYNSFNNKIQQTEDAGGLNITHRWSLDSMSRIVSYTDPTAQISIYHFDSVGRNYKTDYANGFSSNKIFNANNQIIKEVLTSGAAFEYTYDFSNRITTIENTVFPAPLNKVDTHLFTYDGLDRVLSAKAGVNTVKRKYDSVGRLLAETTLGNTITCTYNDAAGIVEKIWPDGRTERLLHNLIGTLSSIEETANGTLGSGNAIIASFKSSGANTFGQATYAGGLNISATYDERKRATEINFQSLAGINENIKYRYNASGIKQVEAILGQNSKTSYFEFDKKYRLLNTQDGFSIPIPNAVTQAQHDIAINTTKVASAIATHSEGFTYNLSDARTKCTESGLPDKNYVYAAGHKVQSDGVNVYTHHTDGMLKSDGIFNYEADALGRIIAIKSGVNTITKITYDAFGRPGTVKEDGKPEKSYNYLGGFAEQINEDGMPARQISIHPVTGIPIAYHTNLGTHYTLFDGRFNLIGLADDTGNLIETYRYKSFGLPQVFDNTGTIISTSAFNAEPIFGGQRFLSTTGLYLSKRRLMNPVNGTFLSIDPKGYADSASLYIYGAQDPINNIDPNGSIIPFIIAAFVIGGALAGAGYSIYDASEHPDRYQGWQGSLRVLGNVFGGAAIGGLAIVAGEAVLAVGGVGIFAAEGTAVALTAAQTFVLYGTASATTGAIGRAGFNEMFPEYIDPVSTETIATDFALGGALPVVGSALRQAGAPIINGARQMFTRAVGGNWRAFGNTWTLLRKGYSSSSRLQYGLDRLFWNNRAFSSVSNQYWSQSVGRANGKALHHLFFQNQSQWIPRGLRNAGFNLLEIPGPLNNWMGGRLGRELALRAGVATLLTGTGIGSYEATTSLLNWGTEDDDSGNSGEPSHPNQKPPGSK